MPGVLVVAKLNPAKQGLKLMLLRNIACNNRYVAKLNPAKQGLKLVVEGDRYKLFNVAKLNPAKQGLKLGGDRSRRK